jgi:predicted RNA-binding protein with PUA-like domain
MKVIEVAHQDPTTLDSRWLSVTFEPIQTFPHPVSLRAIKATSSLHRIGLIHQPRLAVMPLTKEEFECIICLTKEKITIVEGGK